MTLAMKFVEPHHIKWSIAGAYKNPLISAIREPLIPVLIISEFLRVSDFAKPLRIA